MKDSEIAATAYGFRLQGRKLQKRHQVDLRYSLDGSVESAIATLSKAAEGFEDATLEIYADTEYGDAISQVFVQGWMDATKEERASIVSQIEARSALQRSKDEQELARIRRNRPELFK